jgi:hypothetical protein
MADKDKMTGAQKDKLDKMQSEGKMSPNVMAKEGLLNPADWDEFDLDVRPYGSEMQRIASGLQELLDEHFSRNGKYQWRVGFFIEGDPRIQGQDGWRPLRREQLGEIWTDTLQRRLGLHEYEGAICWGGRGMFERHVVCVITRQHQVDLRNFQERQHESLLQAPPSVAGERVDLSVTEKAHKLPVTAGFVDDDARGEKQ